MAEARLAGIASRGLAWTYGSIALTLLVQVLYTAVTARSLGPEVFGAYAASQALAMLLSYLSMGAIGNAVARNVTVDTPLLGTAWTLAVVGGTAAAAAAVLLARPWAALWNVGHVGLIALAAPTVLLLPASNLALALLRRRLEYRRAALVDLGTAAAGMGGLGVAIAVTEQEWLLPLATPVSLLLSTVLASTAAGYGPRLGWHAAEARRLIAFVGPVTCLYFTHYLVTTWPQVLFGRLFGSAALGYLSRCNMLMMMPSAHVAAGLSKVLFPLLNRVRDDPARHRRATTKLLVLASGVSAVVFGTLTGAAEPLIRLLLGEQWRTAAALAPVIGLGAAVNLLLVLTSNVFENAMRTSSIWLSQSALLVGAVLITGGLLLTGVASMTTVLWIFTGAQFGGHAVQLVRLSVLDMVELRPLLTAYAAHAAVGVTVHLALSSAARVTAGTSAAASGAAQLCVALVVTGTLWTVRRRIPAWATASSFDLFRRHPPIAVP